MLIILECRYSTIAWFLLWFLKIFKFYVPFVSQRNNFLQMLIAYPLNFSRFPGEHGNFATRITILFPRGGRITRWLIPRNRVMQGVNASIMWRSATEGTVGERDEGTATFSDANMCAVCSPRCFFTSPRCFFASPQLFTFHSGDWCLSKKMNQGLASRRQQVHGQANSRVHALWYLVCLAIIYSEKYAYIGGLTIVVKTGIVFYFEFLVLFR